MPPRRNDAIPPRRHEAPHNILKSSGGKPLDYVADRVVSAGTRKENPKRATSIVAPLSPAGYFLSNPK